MIWSLAEMREELQKNEIARLQARLDRYEDPGYPLEAEPGTYFLGPAEK